MTDNSSEVDGVFVDGQLFTLEMFSYREQREMRDKIRELAPNNDVDEATEMDIVPAIVWAARRRTDPEYTIEQALDVTPSELEAPKNGNGAGGEKRPPRKRAASPSS